MNKLKPHSDVINKHPSTLIVGGGFVGTYIGKYFTEADWIDENKIYRQVSNNKKTKPKDYDIGFICTPTPMLKNGRCDTSIVRDTIKTYTKSKSVNKPYWCIKSTVEVGTIDDLVEQGYKACFSPEYLGETLGHPLAEPSRSPFIILGGQPETTKKFTEAWSLVTNSNAKIYQVPAKTAELCKLMENSFIATKVMFCNEFYDLAERAGVDYNQLREIFLADPRVSRDHTYVYKDNRGFSGKCLVGGTKLRTPENCNINIEDIKKDDFVFDGNNFTKVTNIATRNVDNVIEIRARGRKIRGSKDHIHFILKNNILKEKELKDLKINDEVFVPIQKEETNNKIINLGEKPNNYVKNWTNCFKMDKDWARIVGLYLAEGCSSSEYSVIWSFGEKEEGFANEVVNILNKKGFKTNKKLQISNGTFGISRCWIVRCRSALLHKIFNNFGKNCCVKNTYLLPNNLAKIIIGGWLDGDGSYYDGTISAHSESTELIKTIDTMLLSIGILSDLSDDGKKIKISCKKDVKEICSWTKRFKFNNLHYKNKKNYKSQNSRKLKNGWAVKINKIEEKEGETVFSIETESHKYVANNILTHNCLPKDINNLVTYFRNMGYSAPMMEFLLKRNAELRKNYKNSVPLLGDKLK